MEFTIPGPPVPKERPRRGPHGNFYTPKRTKVAEAEIAMIARSKRVRFEDNIVRIDLEFHCRQWRGDGDNCEKLVLDALQKADVIKNDKNVHESRWRVFLDPSEEERTVVRVEKIG